MLHGIGNVLLQFCVTSLLGVVSFSGDRLVGSNKILALRAILDNFTHATVGGLSWILILLLTKKPIVPNVYSVIYCVAIASLIDVDHFFAANSWKLRDATNLDRRPFLHCTTVPIILWTLLMIVSRKFGSPGMSNYAWIILTSFLSHHIRDGSRRGLWFAPLGSTRPIPYYLYIALSMGLPYIIFWLMYLTAAPVIVDYKYRTVDIV